MDRNANIVLLEVGREEINKLTDTSIMQEQLKKNDIGFIQFKKIDLAYFCEKHDEILGFLCELARKTNTELITGILYVNVQDKVFEQSVYIDKAGEIKGIVSKKYDEKQLSHVEIFEIFKTTIGTVGIILGKDLWNVEIPRIIALKGAEILFAPDIRLQEKECAEEHILGIAVYNSLHIVYCRQEDVGSRLVFVSPEEVLVEKNLDWKESVVCIADMEQIAEIRKPDPTFQKTMWWLLYGRKPEMYGEIVMDGAIY